MNNEQTIQAEREELLRRASAITSNPTATKAQLKEADVLLAQAAACKTRSQQLAQLNRARTLGGLQPLGEVSEDEQRSTLVRSYLMARDEEERASIAKTLRTYTPMSGTSGAGSDFVSTSLFSTIFQKQAAADRLFDVCTKVFSENGQPQKLIVADDSSAVASVISQNGSSSQGPNPTLGVASFGEASTWRSGQVLVSMELAQDSQYDLEGFLLDCFSRRFARGVGAAQVSTLLTQATSSGVTTASATAVTIDELFDLFTSVDEAYQSSPKCGWLMSQNTLASILKSKGDTSGDYLLPVRSNGAEILIFEKPVYISNSMPSVAAGHKSVAFGAFDRAVQRIVTGSPRIQTLRELNLLSAGCVTFEGYYRTDFALADSTSVKYLTQHA